MGSAGVGERGDLRFYAMLVLEKEALCFFFFFFLFGGGTELLGLFVVLLSLSCHSTRSEIYVASFFIILLLRLVHRVVHTTFFI